MSTTTDSRPVVPTTTRPRPSLIHRLGPLPWVAPAAAALLFVFAYSMVELLNQSFRYQGAWVGLENFKLVLADPLFRTAIWHNALLLLAVPVLVAFALAVAILLYETRRGMVAYRAILFLPYILPIPVIGVVFGQLLQLNGAFNGALDGLGLGGLTQDWLGNPRLALWTMAAVIIWKEVGFGIVLFLARMLSLPEDVYEAAKLDGASTFRSHLHITIPQMKGLVFFYVISEAIVMVSWVFNYAYVMTNGQGGPGTSTVVAELYIYRTAFQDGAPELASASAVLLFLSTLVLIVGFFRVQRAQGGTFGD
ncbi:ABC-type sugar transport system permease subunit [Mycobacterium frederiksbergense]|uniref:ABC-type sugar transport system permease subunit n=1 Tax=Mycolicibacterium frederiksbergense TaxID=117567 RepID=A0ABT6KVN2_9MYCO|nr:sugar ABC transporter permease [Mycolicibacterium frederiksbergense]MDH6194719.1 ABC-type sugar transport system permease subunit [Mycolicibacterium frederiksbergense]